MNGRGQPYPHQGKEDCHRPVQSHKRSQKLCCKTAFAPCAMAGPSSGWPRFPSDYEGDAPKGDGETREVIKLSFQLGNLPGIFDPSFQCLRACGRWEHAETCR